MIRTASRTLAAALAATVLGTAALTAPAHSGGSVSLHIGAGDARSDRAVRTGLALYSMYNDVRGGGSIVQRGRDNSAGIAQDGRRNLGIVHQEGSGHSGTVTQRGRDNAYGLFQFGRNTQAHVDQRGRGGSGATFQWGW